MPRIDISDDIIHMNILAGLKESDELRLRLLRDRYWAYDIFPPPGVSWSEWVNAIEEVERDCLAVGLPAPEPTVWLGQF